MPTKKDNTLPLELGGRVVLVAVAAAACYFRWWIPLVVVPAVWLIWNAVFLTHDRAYHLSITTPISTVLFQRRIANLITWLFSLGYLAYAIVSFGLNLGHWYGWTAGAIVGVTTIPLLRPHRRHYERYADAVRKEARGLD